MRNCSCSSRRAYSFSPLGPRRFRILELTSIRPSDTREMEHGSWNSRDDAAHWCSAFLYPRNDAKIFASTVNNTYDHAFLLRSLAAKGERKRDPDGRCLLRNKSQSVILWVWKMETSMKILFLVSLFFFF